MIESVRGPEAAPRDARQPAEAKDRAASDFRACKDNRTSRRGRTRRGALSIVESRDAKMARRLRVRTGIDAPLPHPNDFCSFELAQQRRTGDPVFMLTERQQNILDFIQREQREKGFTPSTREIQRHFRFASQTSVMQYLAALERKGFLDRHARKARALITPAMKVRITDVPIYGEIPAGMSVLAEQAIEGHVSLDARTVNASKNGRTFALRVRGDSMIDAHILDGDIVILEDRKDAQTGDIVAVLIDGETTLKRYVMDGGRPYLKAENPLFPDLVPARELRIQGVMVSLVRKQDNGIRREQI